MRKLMLVAAFLAVAVISCKKSSDDDSSSGPIPCDNVADFTFTMDSTGNAVFTNTSTGHISTSTWSFGDNTSSNEKNPVHKFTKPGSFSVILTVDNSQGTCSKVITKKVLVPITNSFPVPTTFAKKVLIEEFTGTWCGYCPDGAYRMEEIIKDNPDRVFGASVHQGDPMQLPLYTTLDNTFNVTGFPSGMVARVPYQGTVPMNRGYWATATNTILGQTAKCGLAIDARVSGTDITVEVHAAFNAAISGTHNVTVYLTEDGVNKGTSYDQHNYYNADNTSPFYQLGDPIPGFKHNNVITKVLSADMGDAIPASFLVAGGHFEKTYTATLPAGTNTDRLHVIAFVNKTGASATTHEVLNVQYTAANSIKGWD